MRIVLFTTKVGSLVYVAKEELFDHFYELKLSKIHCFSFFFCKCKLFLYQWTDFRRKQNNPHKLTLNSMFCWFDFFLLFFLIYFSCSFFLAFFIFYFDLVKVVCRLNFVSYYLMKDDPVWYYQASGPMTCIFCYMFMPVYFLSTLDWICVIHI